MTDESGPRAGPAEEIQGAPPVESNAELRNRRREETITVNRYLYLQSHQLEYMLLQAQNLQALIEVLLVTMPRHYSLRTAELWLYDPDGLFADLIEGRERYGQSLRLLQEVFEIEELYSDEPDIELIETTDPRMFQILKAEHDVEAALIVPLTDNDRLIGSLHVGLTEILMQMGESEAQLVGHNAAVISACFNNAVRREQVNRLAVLDPLTQIENDTGFETSLAREIERSQRQERPLTLLLLEIDDFDELFTHYGERRGNFVVRKVTQRLASGLRQTDSLARLARSRLAILLPLTDEMLAQDVAQRMRDDIEVFPIDDGRGAVLQVSLSIGLVTWEPRQYPAVDMQRLATQMIAVGENGLEIAESHGGNRVARSRLSTMMV